LAASPDARRSQQLIAFDEAGASQRVVLIVAAGQIRGSKGHRDFNGFFTPQ
jgi:hypothetical protein